MYAIVRTGGKQYRVTAGSIIEVEKLEGAAGDTVKLDEILTLSGDKNMIGSPLVSGAFVTAQILEQGKADKVLIFKKKRRHNYRRKNGHRQRFTALHILSVTLGDKALASVEPRKLKEQKPHIGAAPAAKKPVVAKADKIAAAKKPAAEKKAATAKKPAAKKAAK